MAISPINVQTGAPLPIPGQSGRGEARLPEDASTARLQGADGELAATAAVDKRVAVSAQRSDGSGNESDRQREPDAKALDEALDRIRKFVQSAASDVQFSVDEESGMRVVKVVDKETQEIIRQMPSKEVVELAKALDKLQGLMIKQTA